MPSSIRAVLLVPADPALLAEGPCESRPPMAYRDCRPDDPWEAGWLDRWEVMTSPLNGFVRALVLFENGAFLPECLPWLGRAEGLEVERLRERLEMLLRHGHVDWLTDAIREQIAPHGRLVLLDGEGSEVKL